MSEHRYSLLMLPVAGGPAEPRNMANQKTTQLSRLSTVVDQDQLERWQQWLGSVEWRRLNEERRLVMCRMRAPEDAASVLGAVERDLRNKVQTAWQAMLLCGVDPSTSGPSWLLTGEARGARLTTVGSVAPLDAVRLPSYVGRDEFVSVRANQIATEWSTHGNLGNTWFEQWIEIDALLSAGPLPDLLRYALLSHGKAKCESLLEFWA